MITPGEHIKLVQSERHEWALVLNRITESILSNTESQIHSPWVDIDILTGMTGSALQIISGVGQLAPSDMISIGCSELTRTSKKTRAETTVSQLTEY